VSTSLETVTQASTGRPNHHDFPQQAFWVVPVDDRGICRESVAQIWVI
jgi:hypothetical protein